MRLKELKCKNCGASIKVEENQSQVECKYCHTSFAVEDAYHYGYKFEKGRLKAQSEQFEENLKNMDEMFKTTHKIFKPQFIFIAVVAISVLVMMITGFVFAQKSHDDFDITRFNNSFEFYNGTKTGHTVAILIDEITTNNKKNKVHLVTVEYKEISTTDPNEIKEIKKQLDDWTKYEVSFEYDEDGYIYKLIIE